ncbi:MAG: tetratricopeptide repeat protein [Thermodesulfobacteriota bacterium]
MAQRDMLDQIVRYFVRDSGGFLLVSHDTSFIKIFKGCLKSLGISQDHLFHQHHNDHYVRQVKNLLKRYKKLILFVEANIEGKNSTVFFKQIKDILEDKVTIICISTELNRDILCLFHEMGADNIIVKPVSINSIVEKIAYTIKPNNLSKMVRAAQNAIEDEDYNTANRFVDEIFKINNQSSIGFILLGDIYRNKKNYLEAEANYKKASQNAKMYLKPLEKLVDLYQETEQDEEQLNILKRMDKLSPLNHDRKIAIGDTYAKLGDVENTTAYYENALQLVRKNADEMMSHTMMQVGKKLKELDPDRSLKYMSKAMEIKKGNFTKEDLWMFNEIGLNLRKQGKWEEAINHYLNALEVSRSDGGVLYNIAMAYLQGKKYYKAIQNVEKAIENNPDLLGVDANIPYNIALIYYYAEKFPEAQQYAKIAQINNPEHVHSATLLKKIQSS